MKTTLSTLTVLALASTLAAQGLSTATGYAVYANAGQGNVQGVPAGTQISPMGLAIRAADGSIAGSVAAHASTQVVLQAVSTAGAAAVTVAEQGAATARNNNTRASAGTSDDPRQGGQAAHGLSWQVRAQPGTTGTVIINWSASATQSAFAAVAVDADGDGTPDFADRVSGGRNTAQQSIRVRAGMAGFSIGIVTSGHVSLGPVGSAAGEGYDAKVTVGLRVDPSGPTCTFTDFGPECAGKLSGSALSTGTTGIGLRLTNAAPNAVAVLVLGQPTSNPLPLPGSRCALLVMPGGLLPGTTDRNGNAGWAFPINISRAVTISFQVVTLDLRGGSAQLGSSNGTTLTCR